MDSVEETGFASDLNIVPQEHFLEDGTPHQDLFCSFVPVIRGVVDRVKKL